MNRDEYMQRLEELLADIPAEEREDAISYYNDYFDAGGEDNEEETIAALGSPEQLASTIKLANTEGEVIEGEFTEMGYKDDLNKGANELDKYTQVEMPSKEKKKKDPLTIILIVILSIFALPVLLPLAIVIVSLLLTLIFVVLGVAFGLACAAVGIAAGVFCAGVVGAFASFSMLATNFFQALTLLGVSLILLALSILFFLGCINIIAKLTPPLIRWIVKVIKKFCAWVGGLFSRKEAK